MNERAHSWVVSLFWFVVLVALVSARVTPGFRALMADDSFQYLSVASNIDHGLGLRTSIVHFDEERSWGVVPAPITTFPGGFPAVVAVLAATGLDAQTAALVATLLASCAVVILLENLARRMKLAIFWRTLLVGAFVLNGVTLQATTYAMSEPLFTAMVAGGFTLLIASLRRQPAGRRWIVAAAAAGLLLGLADWVRYAGLFPFVGVLTGGVLAWLAGRRAAARPMLMAALVAAVPIAAQMLRNVLLVGSWRGGNNKVISRSVMEVAHLFIASVRDLVIGGAPWSHLLYPRMLVALLAVGAAVMGAWTLLRGQLRTRAITTSDIADSHVLLWVVIATYVASILYVASRTMITLEARIFFPILPLVLLLFGELAGRADCLLSSNWTRVLCRTLALGTLLLYGAVQVDAYYLSPAQPTFVAAVSELNSTLSDGTKARDLIRKLVGARGVLMATNGQAVGYLTGAPTVSLVVPEFSARRWDEGYVRDTMRRFNVAALLIGRDDAHLDYADFIGRLGAAHPPKWLIVSGITDKVVIYRTVQPL